MKVILRHHGPFSDCFDFFSDEEQDELKEESGYTAKDCYYVKNYLKENPSMKYICSEDLAHIPSFNRGTINRIDDLKSKGWVEVNKK